MQHLAFFNVHLLQRAPAPSDPQRAIRRAMTDALGPGQQWAKAIVEVGTRLAARDNEVTVLWVPANKGVTANEFVDGLVKEAAEG